jgi:hypothetical protein
MKCRSVKLAGIVLAAVCMAGIDGTEAGINLPRISVPNVDINPQRINPFNSNSDVRRGLAELETRGRQAGRDLDTDARALLRKIENLGSEEAFIAFRDHVISRNPGQGVRIKKDGLHYRMIQPAFGAFDITQVRLHFKAYVPGDMAAITFGNNIYLRGPHRPNDPHQAILLGHELTHSRQYQDLGGDRAFGRRYAGQIWANIRKGNFGSVNCLHDGLGLEQEANQMENKVGKLTTAGVTLWNQTSIPVHYALKRHERGKWKKFTVEPGANFVHSTNFADDYDNNVMYSIHFDHDFADGYQEKAYALDYEMVHNGKPFQVGDGEVYHFAKKGKGIDLFTGKGQPETPKTDPKTNPKTDPKTNPKTDPKTNPKTDPPKANPTFNTVSTVQAKGEITMKLRFQGGTLARFSLKGDGKTDVDVFVFDEANRKVVEDIGATDRCECQWTPATPQVYRVVIRNLGTSPNRCSIAHNGTAP